MSWWYKTRRPVSSATSKAKAKRALAALEKQGVEIQEVTIAGTKIATTFWGKAWCDHLEGFSDYENRLPRGRRYVRNGSVLHLDIRKGHITALVSGTEVYEVEIAITPMPKGKWDYVQKRCTGRIGSLMELLEGRFSDDVMRVVTDRQEGLFPLPGEIRLGCSCPDWAVMCKHVAATLYGVGRRLDDDPSLLFRLRGVDHQSLLQGEAMAAVTSAVETGGKRERLKGDIADIFGIDLDDVAETPAPAYSRTTDSRPARSVAKKPVRKVAKSRGMERLPGLDIERMMAEITGAWIRELRERAGEMEKRRFAEAIDVSPSTVAAWEKRKGPIPLTRKAQNRLIDMLHFSPTKRSTEETSMVATAIVHWAAERFGLHPAQGTINGEFVRATRRGFDMPKQEFATLVGVSPRTVIAWERRKTPLPEGAHEKLAAIVGIDIGEAWDRVIN